MQAKNKHNRSSLDATAQELLSRGVSYPALRTTLAREGREDLHNIVVEDGFLFGNGEPHNFVFLHSDKQYLLYSLFYKEALLCKTVRAESITVASLVKAIAEDWLSSHRVVQMAKTGLDCLFIPDFYSVSVIDKTAPFNAVQRLQIEEFFLTCMNDGIALVAYVDDNLITSANNWYSKKFYNRLVEDATIVFSQT